MAGAPDAGVTPAPASASRFLQLRVFALSWLSYVIYYFTRSNFSAAKKTMEGALHLSHADLMWIDTGYLTAYAVGQFLWGRVVDRLSARTVLCGGMVATGACSLAFGASSVVPMFVLLWTINGLAQSTGWPGNVKSMTQAFGPKGRGGIMGWWSTNYTVGPLVATKLAAVLVVVYGWRTAFRVPVIATAGIALCLFLFLPTATRSEDGTLAPPPPLDEIRRERARVVGTPIIWALGGAYFFLKLIRYFILNWAQYFMESKDGLAYSTDRASSVVLAFTGGGVLGAVLMGWLSDRFFGSRRLGVSIGCLVALAAVVPLFAYLAPHGVWPTVLGLALIGFFLFGPDMMVSGAAAQDIGGPVAAATAAGLINGLGSIGAIGQGQLSVWCRANYGWTTLFWILGGGALVAAAILVPFLRREGRR